MFRSLEDFLKIWINESEATLRVFKALTDASLQQPVAAAGRTLGFIAWHLVQTLPELCGHAGLPVTGPAQNDPPPSTVPPIIAAYTSSALSVSAAVTETWGDHQWADIIPMYGQQWSKGHTLFGLVAHQAHHRGQMTVLMRQAGLRVPGIYGPAREDWAQMGMAPLP